MTTSILVEQLSKQYCLGELHRSNTFRDMIANVFKTPLARRNGERKTIWALQDISFGVKDGEVIGLIGRNGAGKSTLLKLISKITYPTSGTLQVNGRVGSLLEVGTGFHPELTGRENIYLNGAILGMKKREIDRKIDDIIEFSGIPQFINTPIKRYSSGMRLRLGFAVAAYLDPQILLVDEVLAVGDVEFQKKCLQAMDGMRQGGRTVLFVSHNLAAVENLCQRAIWIDNGKLRMDGPSKGVIQEYLASYASADQTTHDLKDVERGNCSGLIRFTDMTCLDPQRNPKDVIRTGDPLVVRLNYEAQERVRQPHIGVKIYSDTGTLITTMNTWMVGCNIPHIHEGKGWAELEIDSLNLTPGRYFLSLWIAAADGAKHDILDHCISIDVEPSDFYESGRTVSRKMGVILMPCKWNLQGLNAELV